MYKCVECEREFDEPIQFSEYCGECWGIPCYQTLYGCPRCKGNYEEIREEDEEDYDEDE